MRTLWLGNIRRATHQLSLNFGVDDLSFCTSIWYDCDLKQLDNEYGQENMQCIYFHILAFEAMKLTNLAPDLIDLGQYKRFHTPHFEKLWHTVHRHIWAQWRFENNLPHMPSPKFAGQATATPRLPVRFEKGDIQALAFCGGGKDSLVCLRLLEQADISYASLQYSSSIYGAADKQHTLIGRLLDECRPRVRHRQWLFDDFAEAPVLQMEHHLDVTTLTFGETPCSVLASLPIALAGRYAYLVLGHERSADAANMVWHITGEHINHQWGKSFEAEKLLSDYIAEHLVDVKYFSALKPLHDVLIFRLVRTMGSSVLYTHSCNEAKPWCLKCAKCAYVWLNYHAHLDRGQIGNMFGDVNVLDCAEVQIFFRQMLGLGEHTPFECIGEVDECRLAFELCRLKGMDGEAMEMYRQAGIKVDPQRVRRYLQVDTEQSGMDGKMESRMFALMEKASDEARRDVGKLLHTSIDK